MAKCSSRPWLSTRRCCPCRSPNTPARKNSGLKRRAACPITTLSLKTDSDHVVLYALKQMEGFYDTDAIARFVEVEGRDGDVTIQLPRHVRATETTLLEDVNVGPLGEGATIQFHMKPWRSKPAPGAGEVAPFLFGQG